MQNRFGWLLAAGVKHKERNRKTQHCLLFDVIITRRWTQRSLDLSLSFSPSLSLSLSLSASVCSWPGATVRVSEFCQKQVEVVSTQPECWRCRCNGQEVSRLACQLERSWSCYSCKDTTGSLSQLYLHRLNMLQSQLLIWLGLFFIFDEVFTTFCNNLERNCFQEPSFKLKNVYLQKYRQKVTSRTKLHQIWNPDWKTRRKHKTWFTRCSKGSAAKLPTTTKCWPIPNTCIKLCVFS